MNTETTAVVEDVLRCTGHITDRAIRAKYIVEDLRLRGYPITAPHFHEWVENHDYDGGPQVNPIYQCRGCNLTVDEADDLLALGFRPAAALSPERAGTPGRSA